VESLQQMMKVISIETRDNLALLWNRKLYILLLAAHNVEILN